MAFPKNKSRRILVNDHAFRWMVNAHYKTVRLAVISETHNGQRLFATFQQTINGENATKYGSPFIVTPQHVSAVILYALENGYQPESREKDLDLGDITHKIHIQPNDHAQLD
jgi:hypothetical protein